jgi:predicted ATPase
MSKIPYGIRSVKIENFRGIEKLELDFTDPQGNPSDIVVIGGPNGCGKTAVLEACLLTLSGDDRLQGSKGLDAIKQDSNGTRIQIDIHNVFESQSYISIARFHQSTRDPQWWTDGSPVSRPVMYSCNYFPSWRSPDLVGALPITIGTRNPFTIDPKDNKLGFIKQRLINLKAYKLMGPVINGVWADADRELQAIGSAWSQFYPQHEVEFSVGNAGVSPEAGFEVFCTKDGLKQSIDKLSAGQLELFCLFAGLAPIRDRHTVVFIDEPELHLDPQWHATLLHELRRFLPNAQFIVATHSPQVFDSVYSYQRHFLVPEDDPRAKAWKAPEKETVPA